MNLSAEARLRIDTLAGELIAAGGQLGADKNYDTKDFIRELRNLLVTPHVAIQRPRTGPVWRRLAEGILKQSTTFGIWNVTKTAAVGSRTCESVTVPKRRCGKLTGWRLANSRAHINRRGLAWVIRLPWRLQWRCDHTVE